MTYLIDTNVLVYALDARDPDRRARARDWLAYLTEQDAGLLSTQALSELANVCLLRLRPRWTPQQVAEHLGRLSAAMDVLPLTAAVAHEALRGVRDHGMSYDDAQMWAMARLHQIPYLLTQHMDSGANIDGVLILDPFTLQPPSP